MRRLAGLASGRGAALRALPLSLLSASRWAATAVTASTFDHDVMQSTSAVCLVYTIDNSKCAHHMALIEASADEICAASSVRGRLRKPSADEEKGKWLKVCQIDGDQNRNLASAFNVERSKLPYTFFLFQGTVVDRVTGTLTKERIDGIFAKFLDYYSENSGVDFTKREGNSGAMSAPLKTNLADAASTKHKAGHLVTALMGPDRIRLPEGLKEMDGLRKELQSTKKAAFDELYALHQKHGLDVRKASDSEMERLLFGTEQFYAAAVLSGLEVLLMARCYGLEEGKSNVLRPAVTDGKTAVERDFLKRQLADDTLRNALAISDVCLVLGDANRMLATVELPAEARQAAQAAASIDAALPLGSDADSTVTFLTTVQLLCGALDHRLVPSPPFPAPQADVMLAALKKLHVSARRSPTDGAKYAMAKTLMLALLQLYTRDAAALAMRSRVSAVLF